MHKISTTIISFDPLRYKLFTLSSLYFEYSTGISVDREQYMFYNFPNFRQVLIRDSIVCTDKQMNNHTDKLVLECYARTHAVTQSVNSKRLQLFRERFFTSGVRGASENNRSQSRNNWNILHRCLHVMFDRLYWYIQFIRSDNNWCFYIIFKSSVSTDEIYFLQVSFMEI